MEINWWRLLGMFGFPGFLALAVLFITWQNWRTRNWRSTFGRIAESRSASRDVRSKDRRFSPRSGNAGRSTTTTTDRIERKNFANVAYEYTVDGKRCLGRKIGIGPDDGTSGDVVASEPQGRFPDGQHPAQGFGFLACVMGYVPVLYQAFSRREVTISLLDTATQPAVAPLPRTWMKMPAPR